MTPPTQTKPAPPSADGGRAQRADARRNREAVLAAAKERFAAKGIECGMDEIARTAGVGVGTVYRHFPTKRDLIAALVHAHFTRLAERAAEALEQDDAWEAFCEFLRESARVQAEDRALSEILGQADQMGEAAGEDPAVATGLVELTEKLMRRAQRAGDMRKDLVVEDVPTMMCGLGAITAAHGQNIAGMNWERFLELALDGMRAPGKHRLPAPKMRIARS